MEYRIVEETNTITRNKRFSIQKRRLLSFPKISKLIGFEYKWINYSSSLFDEMERYRTKQLAFEQMNKWKEDDAWTNHIITRL